MRLRIAFHVAQDMNNVPVPDLIVNMDETAAAYMTLGSRGLAPGTSKATNMARSDKRMATLLSAISLSGKLLPGSFGVLQKQKSAR